MSITNELRESIKQTCWAMTSKAKWFAIADRIDVEHEAQLNDAFETRNSDENQENDGWIRLPKDANNEIVNVGDKLDGYNKTIEVMWLRLGRTGWWIIDKYGESYACCDAFLHHHEPTVEDVLREFTDVIVEWERDRRTIAETGTWSDVAADFIARLQLKETE